VTFVLAVSNSTSPEGGPRGILQGDYEMVVAITGVDARGIAHVASFDGFDAAGAQRRGTVQRQVSGADLAASRLQVLGFHLDDPPGVPGATALGPSLAVTRDLVETGTTAYSFRNYASGAAVSGTLRRAAASSVRFPVLLNGRRVELQAIHAVGDMTLAGVTRPFETIILDHPRYPLSLRIAYGPRGGAFPFEPDFAREIVRIDFPAEDSYIAQALEAECRVEVRGVYFDFDRATLKPQSEPALREIATALRAAPALRVTIEGHTDNIGDDRYNESLSARRAAAVKTALVSDFAIDAARLATAGHGSRRPVESNATLAGRARNRRVELACASDR